MILSWKRNNNNGKTWLVLPESQDSFLNWWYGTLRKIQMYFWLHLFYEKKQKEDQRAEFSVTFISFSLSCNINTRKAARFVEKCKTFQTKNITSMWQIFATNVCIFSRAGKPAYIVMKPVLLF